MRKILDTTNELEAHEITEEIRSRMRGLQEFGELGTLDVSATPGPE